MFGLGAVSGTVRVRTAEIVVGATMDDISVRAVLDASSFDTGNPRRDDAVRSATFLDASTYPDIEFASDGARLVGRTWIAAGRIDAHGVLAPVDVTVISFDESGSELTLRATATVDRYAHGVTAGKGMAGRRLKLDITAVAVR